MRKLTELHVRRGRLLERIATQREMLEYDIQPVKQALDATDRCLACVHAGMAYVRQHPGVVALGVAVLFALGGRRIWRFAKRGFVIWKTWRTLRERLSLTGFRFP
mgnify:CR=1 FL=1